MKYSTASGNWTALVLNPPTEKKGWPSRRTKIKALVVPHTNYMYCHHCKILIMEVCGFVLQ